MEAIVAESGIKTGIVNVYVQGATAAIMIQFSLMYPLFIKLNPKYITHFGGVLKKLRRRLL